MSYLQRNYPTLTLTYLVNTVHTVLIKTMVIQSMHAMPSPRQDVTNLFLSSPQVSFDKDAYDLIETDEPTPDNHDLYIRSLCNEVTLHKAKPHSFKVPNPESVVPSWLQQTRRQLQDVLVDLFFKIIKKRRAVNRLTEHKESLTFPPEYASLKMPQLNKATCILGEELTAFTNHTVLEAKKAILDKQINIENRFLSGYRYMMSKTIVTETYKTLAQTAYRNTYHVELNDYKGLTHILADYHIIHQLCSQETAKRNILETEKRQKLQAAQATAVQQEATLAIKNLVTQTVKLHISKISNSTKQAHKSTKNLTKKSSKNPKAKKKDKPKTDSGTKRPTTKKSPAPAKKSSKFNNKSHLKGSAPKGSRSTSFRPKTGGKN